MNVFTIAASGDFSAALAQGVIRRCEGAALAVSDTLIYLPTQRAARNFGDAFAAALGGAALLPQFRALGEADEDDLLFDAASDALEIPPAIGPLRRQMLLAQMVRGWDRAAGESERSFGQLFALAKSLAEVMDDAERQSVSLDDLESLAPADLAEHWQSVTCFLALLRDAWPGLLAAEQAINPAARRNLVLRALAARLTRSPPPGLVIAAGSTGSIPATADLLAAIAALPNGAVVLPGLDRALDDQAWEELDPGHPQYGLKQLLARMGVERADVGDWSETPVNAAREMLLRETLRPAPTTDAWRALADANDPRPAAGLNGLTRIDAATPAEEALAIALALRESLETPGRTAALVTPDRGLARRVAAELRRWHIAVDDSAGRPLAHTAAGAFLCLLAEAAGSFFAPVPLLALLKHPFATLGQDGAAFRARARELDRWCLRGPSPDAGLAGITAAIARAQANPRNKEKPLQALAQWWDGIAVLLAPLEKLFRRDEASLSDLVAAHVAAAKALACDDHPDCLLWRGADGEAAALLLDELAAACEGLPPVESAAYPALFRAAAMAKPVRIAFGRHPRLAILGTLEARLQRFDRTILGGLNEGSWPAAAGADPWFSRPMRAALNLEQPERAIGLAAHDFAALAAGPDVILTRAEKADGTPTIASRWLQRLTQLTQGLGLSQQPVPDRDYARLAARLQDVPRTAPFARPAPTPDVAARPRQLSVTEIETWLRDPYAIYARHVLKLRPLEALDETIGARERGTALHKALELFVERHHMQLPEDAALALADIADQVFAELGIPRSALAVWRPRFLGAAQWFIRFEHQRQETIARSYLETRGARRFAGPEGDFTLIGTADRIDLLADGGAAILDYKTGRVPSPLQVEKLLAPQLPLEAAILAEGGFDGIGKMLATELLYIHLPGGADGGKAVPLKNVDTLREAVVAALTRRIALFDRQATPYYARVMPLYVSSEGDYDHLARVREWAAAGEEE